MDLNDVPSGIGRVLAVSAHPDDAEVFAGGTLAQLVAEGARVTLVVCTDGSRGGRDLDAAAEERRREQAAAASILGIAEVVHLDHEDGALEAGPALREVLVREIRGRRPEVVLGHDARTLWQRVGPIAHLGHSDHRAVGQALLDAVYPRAASSNFYPGVGGDPWYPRELWLFDCEQPDWRLDVGRTFARKLDALRAHASQEAVAGGLVTAAQALGRAHGADDRPGEAFVRLRLW